MDPIIGSLMIFGGTYAPVGWALCNGQILPIAQNEALFSILGTTYGGDGISTFGLPDLRGRNCIQEGNGPGLPNYALGERAGLVNVSITTVNLPSAPVLIPCSSAAGTTFSPAGNVPASTEDANELALYGAPTASPGAMTPATLNGGNQPINVTNPYNVMNWCIATEGIYPQRP